MKACLTVVANLVSLLAWAIALVIGLFALATISLILWEAFGTIRHLLGT